MYYICIYSKPCVKWPLSKRPKLVFKTSYRLMKVKSIAECSKGQGEHSAILSTFIKLPFVINIFVLPSLVAVLHRFYSTF